MWGLFGVSFLPSALTLAAGAFEPINTRHWPPTPGPGPRGERDWDLPSRRTGGGRWTGRSGPRIRTRHSTATRAWAAGAVLVLVACWLGPRPFIQQSGIILGLNDGFEPAASGPRWGPVSFAVGLAANGMAVIWILAGYKPQGGGGESQFVRL